MLVQLSRKFGPVYVMRGKMPTFPNTYAGAGGKGLEVMPDAQTQYWSLVSCEAAPSGQIVDGLTDMQVPLDKDGNYTIVYSRKEDRPKNATVENGVAWIEWSPRGEGLDGPKNRADFGMLMLRIMANNPDWAQSPDKVTKPGMEEAVMGPYLPARRVHDQGSVRSKGTQPSRKTMKKSIVHRTRRYCVVLLAIIAYKLLWTAVQPKIEQASREIGLTANQNAANGPLPGDVSLYQKELACCQSRATPGYFSSLNGAEIADAERSGFFPCATFTGSLDGPNKVYAWRREDGYEGCISTSTTASPASSTSSAASFRRWTTRFPRVLTSPRPTPPPASRSGAPTSTTSTSPAAGSATPISTSSRRQDPVRVVEPDRAARRRHRPDPQAQHAAHRRCPVENANYKHLTIAPDGTLIMKDQTRPIGSKLQGTMAIIKGVQEGMKQRNSVSARGESRHARGARSARAARAVLRRRT